MTAFNGNVTSFLSDINTQFLAGFCPASVISSLLPSASEKAVAQNKTRANIEERLFLHSPNRSDRTHFYMDRRSVFWGAPGGRREPPPREEIRRSHSAGLPARGPTKPQADFGHYVSLFQVHGEVMKLALYSNGRGKLFELYTGAQHDDWFLRELVGGFAELVRYASGVAFLHRVSGKMEKSPPEWTKAVFQYASNMLTFDVSVPLIMNTIEKSNEDASLLTNVKNLLSLFESRNDMIYVTLFQRIIRKYRSCDDILYSLYRFQWGSRRDLYKYFIILVQYVPFEKLRRSVANILNNPLGYTNDMCSANMYAAIIKFVEEERDRILDYLVSNIDYYLRSHEAVPVVKEVINWATVRQHEDLLKRFEDLLRQKHAFPPFHVEIFDHLLIATPAARRRKFIEQNLTALKVYPSSRVHRIIRYMEVTKQ